MLKKLVHTGVYSEFLIQVILEEMMKHIYMTSTLWERRTKCMRDSKKKEETK